MSQDFRTIVAITDSNGIDAMGEVQASPTDYTLLARLKDLKSISGSVWFPAIIASSGQLSAEVDLVDNYTHLNIEIPAIDSASLSLYVSKTSGGTYQPLGDTVYVAGAGSKSTTFILGGWRYIKLFASVAQTAERTFNVRGINL